MKKVDVISYKHNGELHRVWQGVYIVHEDEEVVITINNRAKVIDYNGRYWRAKEPAVCYFFKKKWYNVICMLKKESILYYANIASPIVTDKEGLKYIDYDLDVKLFPNGTIKVLDRDEFRFNAGIYHYSDTLKALIVANQKLVVRLMNERAAPFCDREVLAHYARYQAAPPKIDI